MIDSSAWVEFLRDTGSTVCRRVEALFGSEIAVCDAVRMEALAGARNERHCAHTKRAASCRVPLQRRSGRQGFAPAPEESGGGGGGRGG